MTTTPETPTTPLTGAEQAELRTAAYGAVTLISLAYPGALSSTRQNVAGAKVLTGATGMIGRVLAANGKVDLKGSSTAEVAEKVLPALTASVATLSAKAPADVAEFRRIVLTASEQAASTGSGPTRAHLEMLDKINAALGEDADR